MKTFLWSRIAEPIINKITDNALEKAKSFIDDMQKKKFKEQFIEKLNEELLNEYGDELYYDELSRLIIKLDILNLIYDRCYEIGRHDFRTDEQFIDHIVEKSNAKSGEKNNLHDAIKHIFDTFFYVLNKPEYDDTRKIINHIITIRNEQKVFRDENRKDHEVIEKLIRERLPIPCENIDIKESHLNNLLTLLPTDYESKLVGRDAMIDKVITRLNDSRLVVLTGMGGIGKTSIAKKVFRNSSYEFKGFVSYEGNMKASIVSALEYNSGIQFEKDSDIDKKLSAIENMINNTEGRKLLIVDNVNTLLRDDISISILSRLNCDVLITSRCQLYDKDKNITIEFLDKDECGELFKRYYTLDDNEAKISEIVELAGRHTMTIELLAKTGEDGNYKLEELLAKLHNSSFDLTGIYEEVTSDWDNRLTEDRLFEHLKKVFNFFQLKVEEKQLLEKITLLTKNQISIKVLQNILELDNLNVLNKLAKKGWIERDRNNIIIHNIVWEIVSKQYEPVEDEVLKIVNRVSELLFDNDNPVYDRTRLYVEPATTLLKKLKHKKVEELIGLAMNLFLFYEAEYEYNKALEIGIYALDLSKELKGRYSIFVAFLSYMISNIYISKVDVEKTIEYADESLRILELHNLINNLFIYVLHNKAKALSLLELFDKSNEICFRCLDINNKKSEDYYYNRASSYHLIGYNFMLIGYRDECNNKLIAKSKYYFLKSLLLNESVYGKDSIECVSSLKNLAEIYELQNDYRKSEELIWRAITSLDDNSSRLCELYNTLSFVYENMGEYNEIDIISGYKKSRKYRKKALDLLIKTYKEPHIFICDIYNNLGCINEKLNEYGEALYNFKQSLKLLDDLMGNHFMVRGQTCLHLARLYSNSYFNNKKRAVDYLEQALNVFEINNVNKNNSRVINALEKYKMLTKNDYDYNID